MTIEGIAKAARSATHVYLGKFRNRYGVARFQPIEAKDKIEAIKELEKEENDGDTLIKIYLELN